MPDDKPKVGVNTGNRGKGRPKGAPNKVTTALKEAILQAASNAGGKDGVVGYLTTQATENPGPFLALLGKVLPMQVIGSGDDGSHIVKIERVIVRPSNTDA